MKKIWIGLCFCLATVFQARVPPAKAADPTGSLQFTMKYQKMYGQKTWPMFQLYDTNWTFVPGWGYMIGPGSVNRVISGIPVGDYYIKFNVWVEDCSAPGGLVYGLCGDPYIPEYYDNSLVQGGATLIHVTDSDTTVLNPVWIETDYYICVTTNPNALNINLGGPASIRGRAPLYLTWVAGQTHFIGVDARVDVQDGIRYDFREWKHGGPREQNYTIPAGTKKDTLVARYTYMYRLDLSSPHCVPWGGGWGTAWRDTLIGVDSTVVEKIPPHAFPAKALTQADTDSVRYVFERWQGFGAGSYSGTDNPASVTMNFTLTEQAYWKTQFRLAVETDTSMGAVGVDPPGLWQDRGDTVALKAVPRTGFAFSGWEGSLVGTADSASVVMDTTKTVIARFVRALHPPVIAMPDTCWAEDDTLRLSNLDLGSWISDPSDPPEKLTVSLESWSSPLHSSIDAEGVKLWTDPDWNGTGWWVVKVLDPEGSSAVDTVHYTVTVVDDPPGPFDLVSPPDNYEVIDSTAELKFVWSTSRNRDAANGDSIRYMFCFGKKSADLCTLLPTADTSFVMPVLERPANGDYHWRVLAKDKGRNMMLSASERKIKVAIRSGIENRERIPLAFGLSRNYPNPFNPSTGIGYALPERVRVRIEIYSPTGKRIRTLVDMERPAGEYNAAWDGADDSGRRVGSGIYVCRMTAGRFVKTIKMTMMK